MGWTKILFQDHYWMVREHEKKAILSANESYAL